MTIRWGALATGRIVDAVVAAAATAEGARFVAVASRCEERARAFARRHGLPHAYGSYDALLQDDAVEAVYVGLPNSMHVEWTRRALLAGKHVLCEKPLTASAAAARELAAVAAARDRLLAEAFMYRHHPQTAMLVSVICSGVLGGLAHVNATMSFTMEQPGSDPRNRPELDGGALLDLGCYPVSVARLLAGEPDAAFGWQQVGPSGVDVRFAGTLRHDDVHVQFDVGMDLPRRDRLELVGTEGLMVVADPWHCRERAVTVMRNGRADEVPVDPGDRHGLAGSAADAYRLQLEALSHAIGDGEPLPYGAADAVAQAEAVEALRRSARDGVPVTVRRR